MPDDGNRTEPPGRWKLRPATDHGMPLGKRLRSLSREPGLIDTALGLLWWSSVRLYLRIYHRLRVAGQEHIPVHPPFIVVANHCSHLDALTMASVIPGRIRHRVYPIAAGDTFFESPAVATFAAFILNALPMWRRSAVRTALGQLRHRLVDEPCAFVLFPEGTRSRSGTMACFKPGLGMIVAQTAVPVIPCYLEGTRQAMPAGTALPRPTAVRLTVGAPLTFLDVDNNKAGWQHIAATTESAVRALASTERA
jgi:1-acyl-sn-glycerol-3-phosphate acyltransferase